jgi:hypothetical protein
VNSMRELSNLPPEARELMIVSVMRIRQGLVRNLSASRPKKTNNDALADLIITLYRNQPRTKFQSHQEGNREQDRPIYATDS